ncbi:MAG: phosphosulfolactate synthase [bacterium]|nr:phosphosulfolactate synthase [bacterium]
MLWTGPPWQKGSGWPITGRIGKPRITGLTMVLDKGLGLAATRDLLEVAAEHLDIVKISFGTSALYPNAVLREKVRLIRSYGVDVCPGGTLLEIAVLQNAVEAYLEWAWRAGFSFLEVSDGTIQMDPQVRLLAIEMALARGFRVITEVGKKDALEALSPASMHRQVAADLAAGAWKVIVEARESGQGVGIYDERGTVREVELEQLLAGVPQPECLLWEAPLKNQQAELILRFGPNVSLGNVQPADCLAVEALRVGLRGDTLKTCLSSARAETPG